jgi:hypothetical protein
LDYYWSTTKFGPYEKKGIIGLAASEFSVSVVQENKQRRGLYAWTTPLSLNFIEPTGGDKIGPFDAGDREGTSLAVVKEEEPHEVDYELFWRVSRGHP